VAIILRVKDSQIEPKVTATLYGNTYYVDDNETAGIKVGFFSHVKSGTVEGKENAALVHANAYEGRKANGIIYDASPRDQYGNPNNWAPNNRLYPYGYRQDLALALVKTGVIEISSDEATRYSHFAAIDKVVKASELKLLQKVLYNDTVCFVRHIDENKVYLVDGTGTEAGEIAITAESVQRLGQMDDPVFLAGWKEESTKGATLDASAIPFPFVTWATGQVVGHIESPIAVRIDLRDSYDKFPGGNDVAVLEASEEQRVYEANNYEAGWTRNTKAYWTNDEEHTPKVATYKR
jgi:hypothetical protein